MMLFKKGCRSLIDTLDAPNLEERFQVWEHFHCGDGRGARFLFASDNYGMAQNVFADLEFQ